MGAAGSRTEAGGSGVTVHALAAQAHSESGKDRATQRVWHVDPVAGTARALGTALMADNAVLATVRHADGRAAVARKEAHPDVRLACVLLTLWDGCIDLRARRPRWGRDHAQKAGEFVYCVEVWTADGRLLRRYSPGSAHGALYVTTESTFGGLAWAPDGARLVYTAEAPPPPGQSWWDASASAAGGGTDSKGLKVRPVLQTLGQSFNPIGWGST